MLTHSEKQRGEEGREEEGRRGEGGERRERERQGRERWGEERWGGEGRQGEERGEEGRGGGRYLESKMKPGVKLNKQWINSLKNTCNSDKKRKISRLNEASIQFMYFSQHCVLGKELEMRGKYATGWWELLMILFQEFETSNQK